MKLGIYSNGLHLSVDDMKTLWQTADRLGFDAGFICDNATNGLRTFPNRPNWDTWTLLPALATVTSRLRMGPLVSPCRRRHPAVMAKMTSTFDVLSEGRLILGMGASDYPQFWRGWGMDYPPAKERIAYLHEEIEVIKRMWQQGRANFDGKYYRLFDAVNLPKPLQDPRPPIWIGLSEGRRLMPEVVAKHGDGFALVLGSDADITERLGDIADACKRVGRDFDEITKALQVYVTVTDDPSYDHLEGIARHGRELELGAEMTAKYVETAAASELGGAINATTYRLIGSPDKISEGLEHVGRLGLDYLIIHFTSTSAPIGGDIESLVADMEIFAAEVMPNF